MTDLDLARAWARGDGVHASGGGVAEEPREEARERVEAEGMLGSTMVAIVNVTGSIAEEERSSSPFVTSGGQQGSFCWWRAVCAALPGSS